MSYSTYINALLYSSSLEALPPYVKIKIKIIKTLHLDGNIERKKKKYYNEKTMN